MSHSEQMSLKWTPPLVKHIVEQPTARWTDDLKKLAGLHWMYEAAYQMLSRKLEEAFV